MHRRGNTEPSTNDMYMREVAFKLPVECDRNMVNGKNAMNSKCRKFQGDFAPTNEIFCCSTKGAGTTIRRLKGSKTIQFAL